MVASAHATGPEPASRCEPLHLYNLFVASETIAREVLFRISKSLAVVEQCDLLGWFTRLLCEGLACDRGRLAQSVNACLCADQCNEVFEMHGCVDLEVVGLIAIVGKHGELHRSAA